MIAEVVRRARRTYVLADHSKFGAVTHARAARLSDVHALVSDAPPPPELARALAEQNVELILAEGGESREEALRSSA